MSLGQCIMLVLVFVAFVWAIDKRETREHQLKLAEAACVRK